jgi:hypothetical protein
MIRSSRVGVKSTRYAQLNNLALSNGDDDDNGIEQFSAPGN